METLKAWHVSIWNPGEMLSFSVNITSIRICPDPSHPQDENLMIFCLPIEQPMSGPHSYSPSAPIPQGYGIQVLRQCRLRKRSK